MKVGETVQDLCPKHDARESCVLVSHSHLKGFCYRVFKMDCDHVYVIENHSHHCDLADIELQSGHGLSHAMGHILQCSDTTLCPECKTMALGEFEDYMQSHI